MSGSNNESCKVLAPCVMKVARHVYTCRAKRQTLQTWRITIALIQALLVTRHDGVPN